MDTILTVGFILSATAFFKKVFDLQGYWPFVAAVVIAILVGEYPIVLANFPGVAIWVDPVVKVIGLAIAAAGTQDFSREMATRSSGKTV